MTNPDPVSRPSWVRTSTETTAGSTRAATPATESRGRAVVACGALPRLAVGSRTAGARRSEAQAPTTAPRPPASSATTTANPSSSVHLGVPRAGGSSRMDDEPQDGGSAGTGLVPRASGRALAGSPPAPAGAAGATSGATYCLVSSGGVHGSWGSRDHQLEAPGPGSSPSPIDLPPSPANQAPSRSNQARSRSNQAPSPSSEWVEPRPDSRQSPAEPPQRALAGSRRQRRDRRGDDLRRRVGHHRVHHSGPSQHQRLPRDRPGGRGPGRGGRSRRAPATTRASAF